jgi:phosphoglycolate phosphatase-like HAD superfamily hydrolase
MVKPMNNLELLIFDLDGVITSEQKYWNTARLTVWEMLCQPNYLGLTAHFGADLTTPEMVLAQGEVVIGTNFITELKNRAVNSNWDLTFFVVSLQIVAILAQMNPIDLIAVQEEEQLIEQLETIGYLCTKQTIDQNHSQQVIQKFWQESIDLKGTAVQDYVPIFAQKILGQNLELFSSHSDLWQLCYQNFQAWYEGERGYQLPDDETVLPVAEIKQILEKLAERYKLAIATGRPRKETIDPLTKLGLIEYFEIDRVVTYDEVLIAEKLADIKLGKPHPFIVLKAIYPDVADAELIKMAENSHPRVAYIGDAASDVAAAQAAGCWSIGVLTGFGTDLAHKRQLLGKIDCDNIIDSVAALPELLLLTQPCDSLTILATAPSFG